MQNHSDSNFTSAPRGLQAFFIHLAGAHPRVFAHLPASEASDYAKMGMTVLIPCVMALIAGTFTLYTLQEEPKSWLIALPFGLIWALMILGMDVAIMSQLVRRMPVGGASDGGLRQAYAQTSVKKSSRRASGLFLALLRVLIAAVLGLVISHCMVLAIFKGRVQARMEEVRSEIRAATEQTTLPALEKLDRLVAMATRTMAVADPQAFLVAFQTLQDELGANDLIPKATAPAKSGQNNETGIDDGIKHVLKPFEDQIALLSAQESDAKDKVEAKTKEIERMEEERHLAAEAMRNERDGIAKTYTWYTAAYKSRMPSKTSDFKGAGSRLDVILKAMQEAEGIMAASRQALKLLEADAEKRSVATSAAVEKKNAAVEKLLEGSTSDGIQKIAAYNKAKTDAEARAREMLGPQLSALQVKRDAAYAQYQTRIKPVTGESYDLLEQTEALHDLALGHQEGGVQTSKQSTILGLILLILLCLMLIDLTPLMMKLMRPSGHYEQWLSSELTRQAYHPRASGQDHSPGWSAHAPPPPRRRQ